MRDPGASWLGTRSPFTATAPPCPRPQDSESSREGWAGAGRVLMSQPYLSGGACPPPKEGGQGQGCPLSARLYFSPSRLPGDPRLARKRLLTQGRVPDLTPAALQAWALRWVGTQVGLLLPSVWRPRPKSGLLASPPGPGSRGGGPGLGPGERRRGQRAAGSWEGRLLRAGSCGEVGGRPFLAPGTSSSPSHPLLAGTRMPTPCLGLPGALRAG